MERVQRVIFYILLVFQVSCSLLKVSDQQLEQMSQHEEFEQLVKVQSIEAQDNQTTKNKTILKDRDLKKQSPVAHVKKEKPKKHKLKPQKKIKKKEAKVLENNKKLSSQKRKKIKNSVKKDNKKMDLEEGKHLPEIEDPEGFIKRRPLVDPFSVGEEVVLDLKYFKVEAGKLVFRVLPFIEVNGKKSYHFQVSIKSSKLFSMFYKLDNVAETYVDYETLRPFSHSVHLKESGQVKEARSFFDWDLLEAHYWEKKITKEHGKENKKIKWKIKDFSQNVISALFYFRTFTFKVGKKLQFYVADDKKNIIFKGKILRKEVIETDIGSLKTIVMKPEFIVDGAFKPVGDIYFWLTDDAFKKIVRIESKIKIGTIRAEVSRLK